MVSAELSTQRRFVVLDGMRGLAALAVITDHIDSPFLASVLSGRYLAVDFFFVLSGFVLSHVYAQRLSSGMSALAFLKIRLIRLYPLYLAGLLAGSLLIVALALKGWTDASWPSIAASTALGLFMLPVPTAISVSTHNIYPFDGPAWTLFFELLANVAFALVFIRLGPRLLGAILTVSAVALVASAAHFGGLFGGYNWENFVGGFPRVFWGFFAGVLVHRLHLRRAGPGLPPWAAFAALLAILAFPATGAARAWFDAAAALVMFPLLVAASASSRVEGALSRASSWLGLLSYGVYILHVPIRDWLAVLLAVLAPGADIPGVAMAALVAGASIGAAAILDKVYDAPARRWLLRRAPLRLAPDR